MTRLLIALSAVVAAVSLIGWSLGRAALVMAP